MSTTIVSSHDEEAAMIGSVLVKPVQYRKVCSIVSDGDIDTDKFAKLWEVIRTIHEKHKSIDSVMVRSHYSAMASDNERKTGLDAVKYCLEIIDDNCDPEAYARIVKEKSIRRKIIGSCSNILLKSAASDRSVESLSSDLRAASMSVASSYCRSQEVSPSRELVTEMLNNLYENQGKPPMFGLSTGFCDLDEKLTGIHPGEYCIIAARPSMGKSTLALNMMRKMSMDGHPVLMFSIEMTKQNVISNIIAAEARVNGQKIRSWSVSKGDLDLIVSAAGRISSAPMFFDDTPGITIDAICAKAYEYREKHGIAAVIIDYIQLIRCERIAGRPREQEVAYVSNCLKCLSKELQIPIITLAQLNREAERRVDNVPKASDLRESGALEQDADILLLLHRPEYYKAGDRQGEADIHIAKQRNGPTCAVSVSFKGEQFRMDNLSPSHDEGYEPQF